MVAFALAAGCGGDGSDGRSETEIDRTRPQTVPGEGEVLAAVDDVGEVRVGYAVFEEPDPAVEASEAGRVPQLPGLLEAGPGLSVEIASAFTGALQVRLNVPEAPSDTAIPVAVHRGADGRVTVEPALWDPTAQQMVVWATSFSDRWGAWYDPRNWVEEVVQVGQGVFDFAADFVTGRTDPPRCANNAPSWGTTTATEAASLHLCTQANKNDNAERYELYLKSNRRTAQLITVPAIAKDYLWVENQPDVYQRLLPALAGVDPHTNVALLGGQSMSLGFQRPGTEVTFDMVAYQTSRIITVNPVFALLGNLPVDGVIGATAAVAKCHAEASGIDITRFDLIPDDRTPEIAFLEGVVRCAFDVLQHPELAFGIVKEVAAAVGVSSARLSGIRSSLNALAPTVARVASGLAIGSALTNMWDGIFDNLADGRIITTLRAAQAAPRSGECNVASIAADLGVTPSSVSDPECVMAYALADVCQAGDPLDCVDTKRLLQVRDGRWVNLGAALQTCIEELLDAGVPEQVATQFDGYFYCFRNPLEGARVNIRGVGPLAAGMTIAEVRAVLGAALVTSEFDTFDRYCFYGDTGVPGINLLIVGPGGGQAASPEDGVIARVQVSEPGIKTISGIQVGSTVEEVRAAYGDRLVEEPHEYDPESGLYQTLYGTDSDAGYGVRFVSGDGIVETIHAGTAEAIQYVEGCA